MGGKFTKNLPLEIIVAINCYYFALHLCCCHCHEDYSNSCPPIIPKCDILFLLDSTASVGGDINHGRMLDFVADFVASSKLGRGNDDGHLLALAQFTPELRVEFRFNDLPFEIQRLNAIGHSAAETDKTDELIRRRILSVPYRPCTHQALACTSSKVVSLNSIVRLLLQQSGAGNGNRPSVPDVVFLITTSTARPVELDPGESYARPHAAPIHFFIISIGEGKSGVANDGGKNPFKPLEFAALTVHLGALSFADLKALSGPLCQSVQSFLGDRDAKGSPLPPATFCLVALELLAACAAIVLGCLGCFARKYRNEGIRYKKQLRLEQEKLQKLDEQGKRKMRGQPEMTERTLATMSQLPVDHPALKLPPVDVLLLVDASGSIGHNMFEQVKTFLRAFVSNVDVSLGRSRIANVLFGTEPHIHFGFNRYHTIGSVRAAVRKMPLLGGGTRLAKALAFASGMMAKEQTFVDQKTGGLLDRTHSQLETLPMPRHERLQILILVSDGSSDDNFDQQSMVLTEHFHIKTAAVVTKLFYRERLLLVTKYEEAIFTLTQLEALNMWLWNQQKIWNERFGDFIEREKTFLTCTAAAEDHGIKREGGSKTNQGGKMEKAVVATKKSGEFSGNPGEVTQD